MRRIFNYILLLLALATTASCTKKTINSTQGMGALAMHITTTRTTTNAYDPMAHLVVSIYNNTGGLIRRYRAQENLPARFELLAGEYRVEVEAGEVVPASFSTRFYTGGKDFVVIAGEVTAIEVTCKIQNLVAEARFDQSVIDNFGEAFHAWVVAADSFVEQDAIDQTVPALKYTANGLGYFTLPEGVTSLAWAFHGEHPDPKYGTIDKKSVLKDVAAPGKYILTFKFSPDLPGYVEAIPIRVDTSAEEEDDTIVFTPDPIIDGVGFDAETVQRYTAGERTYRITAMEPFASATMEMEGTVYDLLSSSSSPINVQKINDMEMVVTLSESFLSSRSAGDHPLKFHITDTDGGELNTEMIYRYDGLISLDINDWNRAIIAKLISFADIADTKFELREKDGEWHTMTVTKDADKDIYTASLAPEWVVSENAHGQRVHSAKIGTGLRPGTTYEYRIAAAPVAKQGEFTIPDANILPDGNMEESSLPCFTESDSESTTFWGSGNNSNTPTLCTQGDANGNHYANMQSTTAVGVMAAGNLFTGTFSLSGLTGTVQFGQKYTYTTRPTALRVKYHASVGKVNSNRAGGPLPDGSQDKARIFVAIVDWNAPHTVASKAPLGPIGSGSCSGSWDPEKGPDEVKEGKIIGYGSMWIETSTEGDALISSGDALQIFWYDKEAPAPEGKYTLAISCAANAYGDFFNGCTTNHLWVDDFEWVY